MLIAYRFMHSELSLSRARALASFVASTVALGGFCTLAACSSSSSGGFSDDAGASVDARDDGSVADTSAPDAGSGDDASDDAPAEATGSDVSCDNLCDAITAYCFASNEQIGSKANCVSACKGLPVGTLGDTADTIGCRQQEAYQAHSVPEKGCAPAGPFGGGICGERCASFCRTIVSACNGAPYANVAACMTDCGSKYAFAADAGAEYTTTGNTLNCRERVLLDILNTGAPGTATACANAGPTSTICR